MPFSAVPNTPRRLATCAAIAATGTAAAVLPTQASASSRPQISNISAVVNQCPGGTAPIVTVWAKGPALTGATVAIGGQVTDLTRQGGNQRKGAMWNANPAGLQVGRRTKLTVFARSARGWTRVTRTVRVSAVHQCQG